jgi:O-antigen/teichoic acid export membrane protein
MIPAALVIAGFSEQIIYLWSGNISLAIKVAPLLALLALGTLCNGLMQVPYMLQLANGWTSLAIGINVVAMTIMIPAILWAVPHFGAFGAACVWFGINAIYVLIGIHYMHRRLLLGEKWNWYKNTVFKPLIVGAITVLVLRKWMPMPEDRGLLTVVIGSISFLTMSAVMSVVPVTQEFLLFHLLAIQKRFFKVKMP